MRISVFGLGYVGCVSMGCLAELGHEMVGVDVNPRKVRLVNAGRATIVEEGVDELISRQRESGRLRATQDCAEAVRETELSLLCVPTPPDDRGHLDMSAVSRVSREIGTALRGSGGGFHTVVLRSTVPPGTTEEVERLLAEASGMPPGEGFGVAHNPEFLREGSSIADFFSPPFVVAASGSERALDAVRRMYEGIDSEFLAVDPGVAEMIKYVSNSFHALKVAFANEVGRICEEVGVDGGAVMEVFRRDRLLNVSGAYLRPGFAYGGSCLPKDLGAICSMAHDSLVEAPVLQAVDRSNRAQVRSVFRRVAEAGSRRVAVVGLSFKQGTDDLRNSPAVELVEMLIGKGYEVTVYDGQVVFSNLTGRNREYIEERLPHVGRLLAGSLAEALEGAGTVVLLQEADLPDDLGDDVAVVDALPR